MRGHLVRRTRHSIANRGLGGTLAESWRRLRLLPQRLRRGGSRSGEDNALRPAIHPFDTCHGVDTSGLIWGEQVVGPHANGYWITGYYAISPSIFWRAMDRLNLDWGRFAFVDIGSGKGRALMLAQKYPFHRIVGVELSEMLAQRSRENLGQFTAAWQVWNSVEVVQADAAEFFLPLEPLVLFLYHPFARPVMERFVERLRTSLRETPRTVYVVYINPELHSVLSDAGCLVKLWEDLFDMSQDDFTVDYFGPQQERVVVFRSL